MVFREDILEHGGEVRAFGADGKLPRYSRTENIPEHILKKIVERGGDVRSLVGVCDPGRRPRSETRAIGDDNHPNPTFKGGGLAFRLALAEAEQKSLEECYRDRLTGASAPAATAPATEEGIFSPKHREPQRIPTYVAPVTGWW